MTTADPNVLIKIAAFKEGIREIDSYRAVKRFVIHETPYILDVDKYFNLRLEVADFFKVHFNDVIMVGSGKLGFSVKPQRRFQPFCDTSDIDIAVISPVLFQAIWTRVNQYNDEVKFWPDAERYQYYLGKGWLWPSILPDSPKLPIKKEWWEFFRSLTSRGEYGQIKIAAGLYYSWDFLETYQNICIKECQMEIERDEYCSNE